MTPWSLWHSAFRNHQVAKRHWQRQATLTGYRSGKRSIGHPSAVSPTNRRRHVSLRQMPFAAGFDVISPETRLGHPFDTFEAEEETVLCEAHFTSVTFTGYVELPSFVKWLHTQPLGSVFDFLRDAMKYLQWQGLASPDKPWLLKAPIYNGMELEILRVFPKAHLVMPHRSPLVTLPSNVQVDTVLPQGIYRRHSGFDPYC